MVPVLCGKGQYQILDKIGEGKFGQVFRGEVIKGRRKGSSVAIKFDFVEEYIDADGRITATQSAITHECKILHYMNRNGSIETPIATLYWYGVVSDNNDDNYDGPEKPATRISMMVTSYFEKTLTQFIQDSQERCMGVLETIQRQMFDGLHHIHSLYVIHRDIKPSNFMVDGRGCLRFIDFGMATFYRDGNEIETGVVETASIPVRTERGSLVGSPNFASIFVHQGWKNQRRDDLISALYVLLYYAMGMCLPWEGLPVSPNKEHSANQERLRRKMEVVTCDGMPSNLARLITQCYQLEFGETLPQENVTIYYTDRKEKWDKPPIKK